MVRPAETLLAKSQISSYSFFRFQVLNWNFNFLESLFFVANHSFLVIKGISCPSFHRGWWRKFHPIELHGRCTQPQHFYVEFISALNLSYAFICASLFFLTSTFLPALRLSTATLPCWASPQCFEAVIGDMIGCLLVAKEQWRMWYSNEILWLGFQYFRRNMELSVLSITLLNRPPWLFVSLLPS